MDELKTIFGEGALTWEQLAEKIEKTDKKTLNIANLAKGGYVDKGKYDARVSELTAAQNTIAELQDAAKKWDGVDVDKLRGDFTALQEKYNTDIAAARLDNVINMALVDAKARDPRLVKSLLDMSIIKQDGESVLGLNDQLAQIQKSHDYLFDAGQGSGSGARVSSGGSHGGTGDPDYSAMSDAEYYASVMGAKK